MITDKMPRRRRPNADELIQPAGSPWVWTAFAVPFTVPLWFAVPDAGSAGEMLTCIALGAGYVVTYGWAAFRSLAVRSWCCAGVTAVATIAVTIYGYDLMFFTYPLMLLAILLPWHWAAATCIALTTAIITADALVNHRVQMKVMALVAFVLAGLGIGGFWRLSQRLRAANATIALMAVHEDRERIARDLHDVLGSTLTVIAVKAGLARRLLEERQEGAARRELGDMERLSRQALNDVRRAVTARHAADLATALETALAALRAAGIRSEVTGSPDDVDIRLREAFAYVLHEAVTNVLRHSRATRCRVRFGPSSIEVGDDGTAAVGSAGNGLSGLTRRVASLGGTVSWGPGDNGGFRLLASCPPDGQQ